MAESTVGVNPGTDVGAIDVATDDILGVHHPFFKMEFGEDGTATQVSETNPLPVTASADTPVSIESIRLYNLTRDIRDSNLEIVKQLKIMNAHFSEWDGDENDSN